MFSHQGSTEENRFMLEYYTCENVARDWSETVLHFFYLSEMSFS